MNNRYIRHFLFWVLFSSISLVYGQSVNISGFVLDINNGNPLVGANVYLADTNLGSAVDNDGLYIIPDVKAGTYVIRVDYIGYSSLIDSITVSGESNIVKDFKLTYKTIEGQEVTVTAQAQGQLDAINKQLSSKSLVNVVSSDRIQELPDANAAESVARIPGVTVKREGGEGNKVVIRGLSPKYNAVTVDGVRLASTDSSDRSTDLSMVSQYMLEGIEVTKAGTPDQDGDVLGGTVNFKLKKAKPGLHFFTLVQGTHNSLKDTYNDNKIVLDVGNRFWNDRIGIFGLIDYENRNRSSQEFNASYNNPNAELGADNAVRAAGLRLNDVIRLNDRQNSLIVGDINLPGGNLSYSHLNSSIKKDVTQYFESYALGTNARDYYSGRGDGEIKVKTQILQYTQTLFSKLHIDASASWSRAAQENDMLLFQFHENQAYTESLQNVNLANIQNITKNDTSAAYFNQYTFNYDSNEETDNTYSFDLGYDFRLFNKLSGKIKTGAKLRKKTRDYDNNYEYAPIDYVGVPHVRDSMVANFPRIAQHADFGQARFSYDSFLNPGYSAGDYLNGQYTLGPFADLDFMEEIFHFLRDNYNSANYHELVMHRFHQTNSRLYDYSGKEDYTASYLMLDLDIGAKLNVVGGARWEKNQTEYTSFRGFQNVVPHFTFNGYEPYTHNRSNEHLLPAFFVRYRPFSWLETRYARTNTLTRPNYTDIIPLYNIIGGGNSVDYRDPDLEPALSKNNDLSVSIIQNHIGFFSVTLFQKDIEGLIYSSGRRYISDPALFGLPEETRKYYIQNFTSNNSENVTLRGLEIDYQTRFWFLPGFLKGLVFNANYTGIRSEVKYPRTIVEFEIDFGPPLEVVGVNVDSFYVDRLLDQPNDIMNLSLGYDYKGFSTRLSMLYKSDVFSRTDFWPELRQSTSGFRRWDFSLKQSLPLGGLDFFLNVSNITEAVDINRLLDRSNALGLQQNYGRTIDVGLRYTFNKY